MARNIDFLLIGGGLAAVTAAKTLRAEGAQGSIMLVSAEASLPYHRPPLSKNYLKGSQGSDRILIEPIEYYQQQSIELVLGTRVTSIQPAEHHVRIDGGTEIGYQKLLIATGGHPNTLDLPGAGLRGVFRLRTKEDADAIRAAAASAERAVVIGGSFLGLEAASTLTEMGISVVLLEREPSLVSRLAAPEFAAFLAGCCSERGMRLVFDTEIAAIEGTTNVDAVVCKAGERFPCDLVLLAVGVRPEVAFLEGSGIKLENGILVDERLRTSAPDIFAAGDVANFYDPVFATRRRLEHWDNAIKQGRLAARNMMGRNLPYDELSYFFSDIFDVSFDVLGTVEAGEETITRGSLAERSYALFHLKDDIPRALLTLGRPPDETRSAAEFIRTHTHLAAIKSRLSDPNFALRDIPAQTVLILQGGGALGAFECGVVRALEEAEIYPDIVAGVSIGAFNGAIIASHPREATAALESFWKDLAVTAPDLLDRELTRSVTAMQILTLGVPRFFRPRWFVGANWFNPMAHNFTSFYDTTPIRELIAKYVDFPRLKSSPVRLMVSAVDVETAQLVTFDSYVTDLTPDHILASGSLPPGFPWTTIDGRHYWDGGIISNSPLDLVIDHCGATGKRVFIVDLFAGRKMMPSNLIEVLARRDEILYAERVRNDLYTQELVADFRTLVDGMMSQFDAETATRLRGHPLYIQLMGSASQMTITRIVRTGAAGEPSSRDYDFSQAAVRANRDDGYRLTHEALQHGPHLPRG